MAILSGLTAFFAGIGTWFTGLSLAGQFLVRIGVGLLLNGVASAIARRKQGQQKTPGVTIQLQQGADTPRSFIMGRGATGGSLVYHNAWGAVGGTPNAYYTRVTALSDLPVSALAEVWIDGNLVTLDMANEDAEKGFPVMEYQTRAERRVIVSPGAPGDRGDPGEPPTYRTVIDVTNYCWVKFHDGTQTAADDFLVGTVSNDARPWSSNEIGEGVAYAIVTSRFNREMFQGQPRVVFVVDGIQIYDPSTDSTGTGDHFPALQALQLLKGLSYGGEWFYGLQNVDLSRFPEADWIAQIEKCRAGVPGAAEMTEQEQIDTFGEAGVPASYRTGGEIAVDIEIGTALESILSGCNGRLIDTGWQYRLAIGVAESASATISDGDILANHEQSFVPFYGLNDLTNGVTAVYPDPSNEWKNQSAPPLYVPEYEAEDGGRRLLEQAEMEMVPYGEQVQRVMGAVLAEARRARRHTIALGPKYWALEPGDAIIWSSDRNGYDGKLFRVDGIYDLPSGDIFADITEVDGEDYNWDARFDFVGVAPGDLSPFTVPAQPFSNLQGFPYSSPNHSGGLDPAMVLTWDDDIDAVDGVRVQLRRLGSLSVIADFTTFSFSEGGLSYQSGLVSGGEYEARAIYIPSFYRRVLWSDWVPVSAGVGGVISAPVIQDVDLIVDNQTSAVSVLAQWLPQSLSGGSLYRLSLTTPDGGLRDLGQTYETSIGFPLLDGGFGAYKISIQSEDAFGSLSPVGSYPFEYRSEIARVGDVPNFRVKVASGSAVLSWGDASGPVRGYHVRHSSSPETVLWDEAVDVDIDVPIRTLNVSPLPGAFLIKAFSASGLYSDNAAVVSVVSGQLSGFNVVFEKDFHPDFQGDKTMGVFTYSGSLMLSSETPWGNWGNWEEVGFWSRQGGLGEYGIYTAEPEIDLGGALLSRISARLKLRGFDPGQFWQDIGPWGGQQTWVLNVDGGWSALIEVSHTEGDPSDPLSVWTPWDRLLAGDVYARGYKFRAHLRSLNGQASVEVSEFSVSIDVPDRISDGSNLLCPPSGAYVSFGGAFFETPSISVDGQDLPTGAVSVRTEVSAAGFRQRFVDPSGNGINCTFDYIAKGYGRIEN